MNCEGCAGCCLDWRALHPGAPDPERAGRYVSLDDTDNLVPLTSDEVRRFIANGYGDALVPRLFEAERGVEIDGYTLAAIGGKPAFYVGLRKREKPVAPFGLDPVRLPACVFLDPETLQCRIHGSALYPDTCATYPGDNLALGAETECERVEAAFGGERLVDPTPPGTGPAFTTATLGATVFGHPDPEALSGRVGRLAAGDGTREDHATFVAVAAASRPGGLEVSREKYETARERVLAAESWVSRAAADEATPAEASAREEREGAPATPGWDGV